MKDTSKDTALSNITNNSLSGWERAISEAKHRITALKRAIREFEELRDSGMKFPEPTSGSGSGLMGQDEVLGQSRRSEYLLHSCIPAYQTWFYA